MSENKAQKELTNKIEADPRTTFGKGVARKLRAAGKGDVVIACAAQDDMHG